MLTGSYYTHTCFCSAVFFSRRLTFVQIRCRRVRKLRFAVAFVYANKEIKSVCVGEGVPEQLSNAFDRETVHLNRHKVERFGREEVLDHLGRTTLANYCLTFSIFGISKISIINKFRVTFNS